MVERMNVPKVWQIEKVGWYRENSVRFVRLSNWRPVMSVLGALVVVPLAVMHIGAACKTAEDEAKGKFDSHYRTAPYLETWDKHDGHNGGHDKNYRGPEQHLRYRDRF